MIVRMKLAVDLVESKWPAILVHNAMSTGLTSNPASKGVLTFELRQAHSFAAAALRSSPTPMRLPKVGKGLISR